VINESLAQDAVPLRAKRVLIVEDEESVASGLVAILDVEGFTTHHVARGGETLEAVESFRPDILLLDIGLPDISGLEVYRRMLEAGLAVPTIFSTGHGNVESIATLTVKARTVFLLKPYDFATLHEAMGEVLRPRDEVFL
jgi:DNA-binding response OmpR family regulator